MKGNTNWWMVVAIVAIVFLLFSGTGMMGSGWCGGSSGYLGYGMMSWMFGNPFGWVFGLLAMVLLWGLAIVILVYFIKLISGSLEHNNHRTDRRTSNARRD